MEDNVNYCILSNNINKKLIDSFNEYEIINDDITFEALNELISEFKSKRIVLNDTLRNWPLSEKEKIYELLKVRHINFLYITSNVEDTLYSDYTYVYDKDIIALEGITKSVLKEEKLLKRLGFGLPFVVDLSFQLKYYNVIDRIYYDTESLVNKLWN